MSRIRDVIKNKNRVEKMQQARRREEVKALRDTALFKAKLYDELKYIDVLLESNEVEYIVLKVPDNYLSKFGAALYGDDLVEYDITQVDNNPNHFKVKRKFIAF